MRSGPRSENSAAYLVPPAERYESEASTNALSFVSTAPSRKQRSTSVRRAPPGSRAPADRRIRFSCTNCSGLSSAPPQESASRRSKNSPWLQNSAVLPSAKQRTTGALMYRVCKARTHLERTLCTPCPHCEGAGYVKRPQTVVARYSAKRRGSPGPSRARTSCGACRRTWPSFSRATRILTCRSWKRCSVATVIIQSDPLLHHEKFDLA